MTAFGFVARRLFGSANDRVLRKLEAPVQAINDLEPALEKLSDEALRARTDEFRRRLSENGEKLDDLLAEAFATVREAAKRTLEQRHFDVQLMGGIVLHQGEIAEMKTGEGKTLVATLPVYLNSLTGEGVHVVTVNDYLARRDADWMGVIYEFLGLEVGCIVHDLSDQERRTAYAADVTYGTNNELGFDYLRDNMKYSTKDMCHRPFHYAIVDEVDSILIDEARTPLIISGPTEDKSELYTAINALIPVLGEDDIELDEKSRSVTLSEDGTERIEELLREAKLLGGDTLYSVENVSVVHHVNQALKAHKLFSADKDYLVKDDKVVIIDEFTGRMMEGRRYSEGLHQALEAKEGVSIQNENQTLASITFQNYFRLYPKLAGMTGTAATEADEFADIYKLDVTEIPTNVEVDRADADDEVYRTLEEKDGALVELIKDCHDRGQPALVGTVSIERSEFLSDLLKKNKVPHNVLNARYHEQEAHIIAQAGRAGIITIATNMAGRGTDIQLGGNPDMAISQETGDIEDEDERARAITDIRARVEKEKAEVIKAGGLYIIGTERHESRRIDNQLRGRAGRQGDPGKSKFFLSLQDDLMRIFGSERMDGMLQKLGLEEGEAIIHPWINRALEKAQQKVEARNFDIRKNLLQYDDVMNDQRKVIYEQRLQIMEADDVSDTIKGMRDEVVENLVSHHIPAKAYPEQWDTDGLIVEVEKYLALNLPIADWAAEEGIADEEILTRLFDAADKRMAEKAADCGPEFMRYIEKRTLLELLDQHWKDHLLQLDHLRQVVGLRAYGQRNPLNEYKGEAFGMFEYLLSVLNKDVTSFLAHVKVRVEEQAPPEWNPEMPEMQESHIDPLTGLNQFGGDGAGVGPALARQALEKFDPEDTRTWGRVPRNAPCPCESGKKFKHCHGRLK